MDVSIWAAGVVMTPEEFEAIDEYDENYRYELVNGVLAVRPLPLPEEVAPNELLGHLLWLYRERDPRAAILDATLRQQYIWVGNSARLADRLIWIGLGRTPR